MDSIDIIREAAQYANLPKPKELEPGEYDYIEEYLQKIVTFLENKPDPIPRDVLDMINEYYNATGKVPAAYEDRLRIETDLAWLHELDPHDPTMTLIVDTYAEDFTRKYNYFLDDLNSLYGDRLMTLIRKSFDNEYKIDTSERSCYIVVLRFILENRPLIKSHKVSVKNLSSLIISDRNYQYAFTSHKNSVGYITTFGDQLEMEFDEKGNIVRLNAARLLAEESDKQARKNNRIKTDGLLRPDIINLLAAAVRVSIVEKKDNPGTYVTVNLSEFVRALGYSHGKDDIKKVNDFFDDLKKLVGVYRKDIIMNVFNFVSYDPNSNEYTFDSPYIYRICQDLLEQPTRQKEKKDGTVIYSIEGVSLYLKPSIATARNKATAGVIRYIVAAFPRRGLNSDSQNNPKIKYDDADLITYEIKQDTLLRHVSELREGFNNTKKDKRTQYLRRVFYGKDGKTPTLIEEYLRKYTYIYEAFRDVTVVVDPPTILENEGRKITITHHGRVPNFELPGERPSP